MSKTKKITPTQHLESAVRLLLAHGFKVGIGQRVPDADDPRPAVFIVIHDLHYITGETPQDFRFAQSIHHEPTPQTHP